MKPQEWTSFGFVAAVAVLCLTAHGLFGQPPKSSEKPPAGEGQSNSAPNDEGKQLVTVAEARERAKLLHEIYEGTLQAIHRRYFKENAGQPIPSRALEDVFSRVARRSNVTARWIAVNAQPMSLDHAPQDEFETSAARSLAAGKLEFELVEHGTYRRAGAITLFASCLKCHAPPPMRPNGNRVAGLVIGMPVGDEIKPKNASP